MADLILVNINPAYQLYELQYALSKVEVSALVMTSQFKSTSYINFMNELIPELTNNNSSTI